MSDTNNKFESIKESIIDIGRVMKDYMAYSRCVSKIKTSKKENQPTTCYNMSNYYKAMLYSDFPGITLTQYGGYMTRVEFIKP